MNIGRRRSSRLESIQEKSIKLNDQLANVALVRAADESEDAVIEASFAGAQDHFSYDRTKTDNDEMRQGSKYNQRRLLIKRDRTSRKLAKAVLKEKT